MPFSIYRINLLVKDMRIVLCFPPISNQIFLQILRRGITSPPLGLAYLASSLEEAGHNVKIIDSLAMNYNQGDIYNQIKSFEPDVVGVSSSTQAVYDSLKILKNVKENLPGCLTLLGGPHPTALAKELLLECPYVDVVIKGEGEKTFVELLEKKKKIKYSEVKGIVYRCGDRIVDNGPRVRIKNLDDLPLPAYHLLPMEKYLAKIKGDALDKKNISIQLSGNILTSRGCPYNCSFCSSRVIWGNNIIMRKPEKVVEELKFLVDKYKRKYIEFSDEFFTINKERVKRIGELIKKEKIDIGYSCNSRVNLFNKEIAHSLKNSGCQSVFFGFESGVQKILDFLCKGFKVEDSFKAVKNAKAYGLKVNGHFIIGVPGETRDMINKTIDFALKLDLGRSNFSFLTPYPGTKIYEFAERNSLLRTKNWLKYNLYNIVLHTPGIKPFELKLYYYKALFSTGFKKDFLKSS